MKKLLITLLILLLWLSFIAIKIKNYYQPPQESLRILETHETKTGVTEYTYGIYFGHNRIGSIKRITLKTDKGYSLYEDGRMLLSFLGEKQELSMNLFCNTDNDFRLQNFSFQVVTEKKHLSIRGESDPKGVTLHVASNGKTMVHSLSFKEKPFLPLAIVPYLVKTGFTRNRTVKIPVFDPSAIAGYEADVILIGWENLAVEAEQIRAFHLKTVFKGIEIHAWVDESGSVVKEVSPVGLKVLREKPGKSSEYLDVAALASIQPEGEIRDSKNLSTLILRLTTREELLSVIGKYQDLNAGILELHRGSLPRIKLDPGEHLSPSPFITSESPAVMAALQRIIKNSNDPDRKKVAAIMRWVFTNMKKAPTFSIPVAADVLNKMSGDCNEHAVLFAALCRAAKIPCAIASGIVYNNGKFFYHAWNLVYIDNMWTDVDSTFGQFPADPTHIIFALGDISDGIEVMQFVRNIQIEVVKAQ